MEIPKIPNENLPYKSGDVIADSKGKLRIISVSISKDLFTNEIIYLCYGKMIGKDGYRTIIKTKENGT